MYAEAVVPRDGAGRAAVAPGIGGVGQCEMTPEADGDASHG